MLDKNPGTRLNWTTIMDHPFWRFRLQPRDMSDEPQLRQVINALTPHTCMIIERKNGPKTFLLAQRIYKHFFTNFQKKTLKNRASFSSSPHIGRSSSVIGWPPRQTMARAAALCPWPAWAPPPPGPQRCGPLWTSRVFHASSDPIWCGIRSLFHIFLAPF